MKILLLIDSLIQAGAEILTKDLALRLKVRGVDVTVAVLQVLGNVLEEELQTAGIPFLPLPSGGIYSVRHVVALAKSMPDYDLVHVHLFPAQLWAAIAAGRAKRPTVLVTTEHNPVNNRRRRLLRPIDRWIYHQYRAIACNSQATASALAGWVPEATGRIEVIPNGIAVERFSDASPASRQEVLGAELRAPLLISVARLQAQKDHATLLQALAIVPGVHLALVGDGELRPRLEALSRRLHIAERVHFLGRRADVPQLLKMSDIFVHATHSDGFCLAALEAMAAGLPVVTTKVPGLAEVVADAGILTLPCDPASLATAISSLLGSDTRRKELSAASRQRARQFSIESTVEAYLRFYHAALTGTAGRSKQA